VGHTVYDFADFRVDATQRLLLLKDSGRALPLSSRAFDALLYLIEHRGELLDKSTLMAAVWPNVIVEENNLNQHISALRRVLGETRDDHRFIVTVPGRGYRFVADVTIPSAVPASVSRTDGSAPAAPEPGSDGMASATADPAAGVAAGAVAAVAEGTRSKVPKLGFGSIAWVAALVLVAVVSAAAWELLKVHHGKDLGSVASSPEAAPALRRLRIAVVPFQNLSPESSDAFFADGLHEEIVSTLTQRLRGVEVISSTTMMSRDVRAQSVGSLAKTLHATHVLEGSVRREGTRVRLTLQLVDARADEQKWAKNYDRNLTSALTLQSEVADEVASQLAVQLVNAAAGKGPPTVDPEAYDDYLKAVLALRSQFGDSLQGLNQVRELLTRALIRDPRFALAYAQRARTATLSFVSGNESGERLLQGIRDDLASARGLAPEDPVTMAAEGYFHYATGDNERALASLDAAQAAGLMDPAWLIPKARVLMRMSRVDEALRLHRQMLELDPGDPLVIAFAVQHLVLARQPAEALRVADLAAGQFPETHRETRGFILLSFTGNLEGWRDKLERCSDESKTAEIAGNAERVWECFQLDRYAHRYGDLSRIVRQASSAPVAYGLITDPFELYDNGELGTVPGVGELKGWAALLVGDRASAERAGRELLEFLRTKPRTSRNEFFLRRLEAEGQLFDGLNAQAIEAAKASLALVSRQRDAVSWVGVAMTTARIYAWAGAAQDCDALLDQLSAAVPGLPPAVITRDPLFAVPLANDAGYRAITARLEAQIGAMNLH
jgi:TolB-like protein/DNA-binding winged helix-turn-helix (wHTH) protein